MCIRSAACWIIRMLFSGHPVPEMVWACWMRQPAAGYDRFIPAGVQLYHAGLDYLASNGRIENEKIISLQISMALLRKKIVCDWSWKKKFTISIHMWRTVWIQGKEYANSFPTCRKNNKSNPRFYETATTWTNMGIRCTSRDWKRHQW